MFLFEGQRPERQKTRARCESALLRLQENSVRNFTGRRGPVAVILPSIRAWFFLLNIKTESRQTDPAGRRYTPHRLTLFPVRLFRPLHLVSAATPPRTTKRPIIPPARPNVSRAAQPAFFAYFNLSAPPKYLSAKWYNIIILITVGEYFL